MAQVTASQPPGNSSAQPSSSGSSLSLLPDPDSEADQTQARAERIVCQFEVSGRTSAPWALYESRHNELVRAFPAVNADEEYAKITAWISANPKRRKTPRGMPAFLFRWFETAQNNAGRAQARQPAQAIPFAVREEKERSARHLEARAKLAFGGGK